MQEKKTELIKKHVGATSSRPHSRGITLIALIITIIVMLILVGVTINVALNGGLFEVAKRAVSETQIEADKEMLQSEVIAAYDVNTGTIDRAKLKTNLEEAGWTVETEKRETIYISPNNNKFAVNENLEIEYVGKHVEEPVTALDDDNNPLTIGSIEDLVDFAIAVNEGTTYEGETVTLLTSLDFDNPESYRTDDPDTTIYTDENGNEIDINGNDTEEPIMTELTTGTGFMPIGKTIGTHAQLGLPLANSFAGTFDGNGKTISNLYISRPTESAALFGDINSKAKIMNLTIKNPEIYGMYASGLAIANSVPNEPSENVVNYMNDLLTIENCHTKGGKIGAVNENCISQISAGLFIAPKILLGKLNIIGNTNESVVSGCASVGLAYLPDEEIYGKPSIYGEITIAECSNYGDIVIDDIDTYKETTKNYSTFTAGCVSVLVPCTKGLVISDCANYGELTGVNSIVGVAVASNASVSNCSNYGTLSSLSGERILIAGVVCDNAEDAPPDGIEKKIEGCRNYGDINISSDNMNEFKVAGITNGSYKNKVLNCINEGNISISGTINYNSSGLVWQVAGINGRYDSLVTNCINYGNITVDTQWKSNNKGRIYISGISYAGDRIINCANYGTLKGGVVSGIAYGDIRDVETQIYNCYNVGNGGIGAGAVIKNSCCLGNFGSNSTVDSSCHALTGNETPEEKQALLTELNNQVAIYNEELETDTETPWSEWKIDPNMNYGYPSFSWQQAEE